MNKLVLLGMTLGALLAQLVYAEQPAKGRYHLDANGSLVTTPAVENSQTPQAINTQQSEIITVGTRSTGISTILGGSVVPYREVTLTAQLPGRIEFIAGREGDRFHAGELLLALSDNELLARRQQALANLNNSVLALRDSQMQYGREWITPESRNINRMPGMGLPSLFDQMFTRNIGSGMGYGNPWLERYTDLYSSNIRVGQAQGNQIGAMSQLREIDAKLRDSRTISPFEGVILQKMVESGDTVQPGQPLLKYADLTDLQLSVEVPSRLLGGVQEGMIVPAILDFNNQYLDVRISQIYPMGNLQRHTVTVKFDLPVGTSAWPGTYAEVMLPETNTPVEKLIEIPKSAVIKRGSLPVVYVIKDNKPELRLVRLGASYTAGRVTVLAGLNPGDRILANPATGMTSAWDKTPYDTDQ